MSQPARTPKGLKTRPDQPLIGVPISDDGDEVVHYFASEEEADHELARDERSVEHALSLACAWQELDAVDGPGPLDELDRMRHAAKPSPPLKL